MTRRLFGVTIAIAAALIAAPSAVAAPGDATELFRFQDPAIKESSGVAVATRPAGVIYTHNDSGDAPRFFAVDRNGCTIATYTVEGAEAIDWEDMTRTRGRAGRATLWFGDIGDNNAARAEGIAVYRVSEPRVTVPKPDPGGACPAAKTLSVPGTRLDLRYADGPHDAETILVQPKTNRLFIVTKSLSGSPPALYAAPRHLEAGSVAVLERVADLALPPGTVGASLVTSGAVSPDGRHLILRTYREAFEWRVRNGDLAAALSSAPKRIALPPTLQGESIGYTSDGNAVITTTEDPIGTGAPVSRIQLR